MDESFSLDDVERMELDETAQRPNVDANTMCSCEGLCLRGSGRNACPCKTIGQYCTSACHPPGHALEEQGYCMNSRQLLESDTSESESEEDSSVSLKNKNEFSVDSVSC